MCDDADMMTSLQQDVNMSCSETGFPPLAKWRAESPQNQGIPHSQLGNGIPILSQRSNGAAVFLFYLHYVTVRVLKFNGPHNIAFPQKIR